MPFTLTMPKLSPTMEKGTIAKWHKKVGDFVEAGDVLLEASTDKATVEYNAIDGGFLRKILINEGQDAIVNQAIAIMSEDKAENIDGYKPTGDVPQDVEEEDTSDNAAHDEEVKPVKQTAKTSDVKGLKQASFVPEKPLESYEFEKADDISRHVKATPLAKKIAREKGLDLTTLKGTGPGNRIVSTDLVKAENSGLVAFSRNEYPEDIPGSYEEETLSPMRKVIGERLQDAKTFIPHFYVSMKIDAKALMDTREQLRHQGIKLTFNDFIVRASALALRKHPNVNSGFNSVNNTIIRFKTVDISIAVSLPSGLITPIVRHADFKNIGKLSLEVKNLAAKAKDGKLEAHEYKGGSFTISNLGMYGVSEFIAIINPPQAAILAVGGILETPVVKNGTISIGYEMTLTLSGDHRVIDGVAGAEFLKTMQKLLENPAVLLV